jgi:hypothetical protein
MNCWRLFRWLELPDSGKVLFDSLVVLLAGTYTKFFWALGSTPTAPTNFIDFKSLAGTFDTNKAFDTN